MSLFKNIPFKIRYTFSYEDKKEDETILKFNTINHDRIFLEYIDNTNRIFFKEYVSKECGDDIISGWESTCIKLSSVNEISSVNSVEILTETDSFVGVIVGITNKYLLLKIDNYNTLNANIKLEDIKEINMI